MDERRKELKQDYFERKSGLTGTRRGDQVLELDPGFL
jgi:hypothetical protein